ncbi:MAG: DUF1801 domain-containing protein [Rhodoglobus sp.]
MNDAKKTADTKHTGFTSEERAAMKERAKELKANASKADDLRDVLQKIAEMPEADRAIATRLHELITTAAPSLVPKTWYGQPAYAKDGRVVCFFQSSDKFNTRYSTLGFSDVAAIDDGSMWPTSFAVTKLTAADEAMISALITKSVG